MKSMPVGDIELRLHQSEAALFGKGMLASPVAAEILLLQVMENSERIYIFLLWHFVP